MDTMTTTLTAADPPMTTSGQAHRLEFGGFTAPPDLDPVVRSSRIPRGMRCDDVVFVTAKDLVRWGDCNIRVGAVGIWNKTHHLVSFRRRDICDSNYTGPLVFIDEVVTHNVGRFTVEEA